MPVLLIPLDTYMFEESLPGPAMSAGQVTHLGCYVVVSSKYGRECLALIVQLIVCFSSQLLPCKEIKNNLQNFSPASINLQS